MERWVRFFGIIGVVILLFGVVGVLLGMTPSRTLLGDNVLVFHFIAGIALIIYWFVLSGFKNIGAAGSVVTGRTSRYGMNVFISTGIIIGILAAVNYLAHKRNKRWDLTEQGVFSLSDQSRKILSGLNSPLKIVAFKTFDNNNDAVNQYLTDLLELYREANPSKIDISIVDPRVKINLVEQYDMKQGNIIYMEYGSDEKKAVSRLNDVSEEVVTNAVIKLTRVTSKKIYYVTGHEEPDIKSEGKGGFKALADGIANEHLTLEPLLISTIQKFPEDTAAVILASPKKSLLPEEKELLIKYAQDGGHLLMFNDPRTTPDIREIADKFGIIVGENVVIDQVRRAFSAPALGAQPIAQEFSATSPITKAFTPETTATAYNIASSVTFKAPEGSENDATYTELVKTSPTSWAESNLSALFDSLDPAAQKEDNDIAGPVSLAVAYEKKLPAAESSGDEPKFEKISRIVVFGDSDWVLNDNIKVYSNLDFVLNSISWVAGEEGGITIRPKKLRSTATEITMEMYLTILRSSLIVPELILLLGLFIWWRRRGVAA